MAHSLDAHRPANIFRCEIIITFRCNAWRIPISIFHADERRLCVWQLSWYSAWGRISLMSFVAIRTKPMHSADDDSASCKHWQRRNNDSGVDGSHDYKCMPQNITETRRRWRLDNGYVRATWHWKWACVYVVCALCITSIVNNRISIHSKISRRRKRAQKSEQKLRV